MKIENVFAALETYFEAKKAGSIDLSEVQDKAKANLDLYIKDQFNQLILEDKKSKTPTIPDMLAVSPAEVKVAWEDVVNLLDALNSSPMPLSQDGLENHMVRWMEIYTEWYRKKRVEALLSVTPISTK